MGFFGFLFRQWFDKPSPIPSSIDLSDRTALVTGSNVGLGLEIVRELAQHGVSCIILGVRSLEGGETAKSQLQNHYPNTEVQVWQLDLNSYPSIVEFSNRAQDLDRLDIVLLNAGVQKRKFQRSSTGHELHIQVNYLSTALLSLLLLPRLKATSKSQGKASHLTIFTSERHEWTSFKQRSAPILFATLDEEKSFSPEHYNISKLLILLWSRELASKVSPLEVIINSVNPGLCWSSLHRDQDSFGLRAFKHATAWTSEQGGHCLADAAVAKTENSHGCYVSEQKIKPASKFVEPAEAISYRSKLWTATM